MYAVNEKDGFAPSKEHREKRKGAALRGQGKKVLRKYTNVPLRPNIFYNKSLFFELVLLSKKNVFDIILKVTMYIT